MNTPNHLTLEEINSLTEAGFIADTSPRLRVGDLVAWRGGWGLDAPKMVKVTNIEVECNGLAENGEIVKSCTWEQVRRAGTVVDLDNGRWAYGYQLYPTMEEACRGSR